MSIFLETKPEELTEKFLSLKTPQDIANLLEVEFGTLKFYLFVKSPEENYKEFTIKKASGGYRQISAPISNIKNLQRKLLEVLYLIYIPKAPTHGFIPNRNILSNAKLHCGKHNVFNVDIKDFFPSITIPRVIGLFQAYPCKLPDSVAFILAKLCCYKGQLPQGAPTSPIISNMICSKLDSQLRLFAKDNRCDYTRYADDITFSTTVKKFPGAIATILSTGAVQVGFHLEEIITNNGFELNYEKVRLQTKYQRQEVTGLTTNIFPNVKRKYIRQIRAMLHDWETNGYEKAQIRHFKEFSGWGEWDENDNNKGDTFAKIVKGKIDFLGMVKGKDDPNFLKFIYKYARLNDNYNIPLDLIFNGVGKEISAVIYAEGKTDRIHIYAALERFQSKGLFANLKINIKEVDGDKNLVNQCIALSQSVFDQSIPCICLFDNDNNEVLRKVHLDNSDWYDWGKKVFSLKLPVPKYRENDSEICIELLYKDKDLQKKDTHGRRLFLSNEFNKESGRHKTENLNTYIGNLRKSRIYLIDNNVYDENSRNVALSKSNFAENVANKIEGFDKFDLSGFKLLFELVEKIVS